jgi:hypothetical protein
MEARSEEQKRAVIEKVTALVEMVDAPMECVVISPRFQSPTEHRRHERQGFGR